MSDVIKNKGNSNNNIPMNEKVPNLLENINKTNEIEKQYLEGELHKEIKSPQINENTEENNNNNIIEEKKNSQQYTFLKDKLSQMNTNKNITQGINKSMDKQMKNLHSDFFENKILMTEIPKKLDKLLSESLQKSPNYETKNKIKAIRELQEEKNILNLKLQKIITNEKFLDKEGYMESGEVTNRTFSPMDQKVFEDKKKVLKEKKNDLMKKIEEIEEKLNKILINVGETSRKERLKNYIENFEKDKEVIENRAKKYYKEAKERNQRMANDLNNKLDKIKKELNEKSKEEELKKAEMLKKLKDQEKATLQKRSKINDEKANIFKPFINKKIPKEDIRKYLFVKKYQEYQQKEKTLVDQENLKRKEKMKLDFNEINEFEKNVINNMEKVQIENEERKKKLLLEWKERKGVLPTYISPKQELVQEELKNKIEEEENKKEKNIELKKKRYEFGYEIKNNQQPEINQKLKRQRTNLIKSLENPKMAVREKLLFQRKKKAEELENKNNSNNINKSKDKENNVNKSKNKKVKINKSIIKLNNSVNTYERKKPATIKFVYQYPFHPKPEGKIDYLNQMRIEKEKRKLITNTASNDKDSRNKVNNLKWEKEFNSQNGTFIENVNFVKEKAKIMDNELKQNQKILNLYGGVKNNPKIANKISNLLIDSIEAKLSILNKFENN